MLKKEEEKNGGTHISYFDVKISFLQIQKRKARLFLNLLQINIKISRDPTASAIKEKKSLKLKKPSSDENLQKGIKVATGQKKRRGKVSTVLGNSNRLKRNI